MPDKTKKIKLLIVDDEEDFLNSMAERLGMRDFGITTASEGKLAVKIHRVGHRVTPGAHHLKLRERLVLCLCYNNNMRADLLCALGQTWTHTSATRRSYCSC